MTRTNLTLDAAPPASNGRAPLAATPPRPTPPAVVAHLDLERPASGIAALLTGARLERSPASVEPCRRPRCTAPATTTGDCLAHREQIRYDADEEEL